MIEVVCKVVVMVLVLVDAKVDVDDAKLEVVDVALDAEVELVDAFDVVVVVVVVELIELDVEESVEVEDEDEIPELVVVLDTLEVVMLVFEFVVDVVFSGLAVVVMGVVGFLRFEIVLITSGIFSLRVPHKVNLVLRPGPH